MVDLAFLLPVGEDAMGWVRLEGAEYWPTGIVAGPVELTLARGRDEVFMLHGPLKRESVIDFYLFEFYISIFKDFQVTYFSIPNYCNFKVT